MKEILGPSNYQRNIVDSLPPEEDGVPLAGVCDQEQRIIDINREEICCKKDFFRTISHEEIHASYPELDERETWAWTAEMKKLKPSQKKLYFNLYDTRA